MSETPSQEIKHKHSGISVPRPYPFGCSFFLLDFIGFVYIVSHWTEVTQGVARLFQHFGL